jgi:predicted membrane metal-binding protein
MSNTNPTLTVGAALADLQAFRNQQDRTGVLTETDAEELLVIADTLAAVLQRVQSLETSRIGAGEYLANFDGNDFDAYSFYQGVGFALAKVDQAIRIRPATEGS